jgi:preprotein translocase subunit SecA
MNRHRTAVYAMRREILKAEDISKRIKILVEEQVHGLATSELVTSDQFEDMVREIFPFDEKTLDKLFDSDASQFEKVLQTEATKLYKDRETTFTPDIMRRVERDIYLQVLDNLWMQHLENMDHLREGIHWMSVGQQDPLVEYRRRGQVLFDGMQLTLCHDVLLHLFHAEPVSAETLERATETDLTRAARGSVENASQITDAEVEFEEADFNDRRVTAQVTKQKTEDRKKARKNERKRKSKARRRK